MDVCWIGEAGCRIDFAAWTQAIGSVLAILAAIWIASSQSRAAETSRRHQAISDFTRIRLLVLECHEALRHFREILQDQDTFFAGKNEIKLRDFQILADQLAKTDIYKIPPIMIGRVVVNLRKHMESAELLGRFAGTIERNNEYAEQLIKGWHAEITTAETYALELSRDLLIEIRVARNLSLRIFHLR
jgi:hypothetical protein